MEILLIAFYVLFACSVTVAGKETDSTKKEDVRDKMKTETEAVYDRHTKVWDVINDPVFEDYGRLIFPVDMQIDSSLELENVIEIFKGLSHGFGLGEGTVAEGWLDHAVEFWKNNME